MSNTRAWPLQGHLDVQLAISQVDPPWFDLWNTLREGQQEVQLGNPLLYRVKNPLYLHLRGEAEARPGDALAFRLRGQLQAGGQT